MGAPAAYSWASTIALMLALGLEQRQAVRVTLPRELDSKAEVKRVPEPLKVTAASTCRMRRPRSGMLRAWLKERKRKSIKRLHQSSLGSLAELSTPEQEEEEPESIPNKEHPWQMTFADKLGIQAGWLVMFAVTLLVVAAYIELGERVGGQVDADKEFLAMVAQQSQESGTTSKFLFRLLWGQGALGAAVSIGIVALSLANFYFYSESTVEGQYTFLPLGYDPHEMNRRVEKISLCIFLPITMLRVAVVHAHPHWSRFEDAAWRYVLTDVYNLVEVFALAWTLQNLPGWIATGKHDFANFLWLFFARSMEMLELSGAGLGLRRLRRMVTDDGKLLTTAFIFGLVVWLVMSGLYYSANHKNDQELAVWEVAEYNGRPWHKFESIPSTMWYVLINLLKEHPLADAHETFWSRLWVCVVCIFAMPVFAVPLSILQQVLFKQELEEEEAGDAAGPGRGQQTEQAPAELDPDHMPFNKKVVGYVTAVLSYGSIFVFFFYTAKDTEHARFLGIPVLVNETALSIVDGMVGLVFMVEWLCRLGMEGPWYLISPLGIIDFVSFAPGIVQDTISLTTHSMKCEWWSALCVLRSLKLERYLHCFQDIVDIIVENRGVFAGTTMLSLLCWMTFSQLLYLTERDNPDPEMREVYGSNVSALWAEIINLHGEWPWADYTTLGKCIGCFIGFFSIMLFCVPISIFSNCLSEKIEASKEGDEEYHAYDRRPWQQLCRPAAEDGGQKTYDLLYAHLHELPTNSERGFLRLRAFAVLMVTLGTLTTIVGTLESSRDHDALWYLSYVVDTVVTVFFAAELSARVVATGWRHPCSFIGICDILSLLAFTVTLAPKWRDNAFHPSYDSTEFLQIVILLRLLRLFALESYFGAIHTLRNVLWLNRWPLIRAGGALVSTWFIHATFLYLVENTEWRCSISKKAPAGKTALLQSRDDEDDDDEVTMAWRYRSVLSSLQYSIVHLFGDFPETDYTPFSKIVHFFGIMFGIAIIASFCGVFSASFISYLEEQRKYELQQQALKQAVAVMNAVRAFQRAFRRYKERQGSSEGRLSVPPEPISGFKKTARDIVCGTTATGRSTMLFFNATLIVALVNSMVSSLPEANKYAAVEYTSLAIEMLCTAVFVYEYLVRLSARPRTVLSTFRLVDLACLVPGPVLVIILTFYGRSGANRAEAVVEALSMFRAVRILEFSYFHREVVLISRALADAWGQLMIPAYLSLTIWITTSALFMWLENYWQDEGPPTETARKTGTYGSMTSVPAAMYWCCIFLTGEWANVDFTYAGSRLCIFYVLFGIAMFSIPVGIIVEAVQSTVQKAAEEEKEMRLIMGKSNEAHINTALDAVRKLSLAPRASGARRSTRRPTTS